MSSVWPSTLAYVSKTSNVCGRIAPAGCLNFMAPCSKPKDVVWSANHVRTNLWRSTPPYHPSWTRYIRENANIHRSILLTTLRCENPSRRGPFARAAAAAVAAQFFVETTKPKKPWDSFASFPCWLLPLPSPPDNPRLVGLPRMSLQTVLLTVLVEQPLLWTERPTVS